MGSRQFPFQKRRFARARMEATAFVLRRCDESARRVVVEDEGAECLGPLAVENVSAGGALLLGGARWHLGQIVGLELRLRHGLVVRGSAMVVRVETHRGQPAVAMEFQDLPREMERAIQEAVREAL